MRKKIALVLVSAMMITSLAGCGKKENTDTQAITPATEVTTEATATDTTEIEATMTDASATDAVPVSAGTYNENVYTNEFAGFQIDLEGSAWKFYDAAGIATAAGIDEADVQAFWDGTTSPFDTSLSYCAIAYDSESGSNIIINYFNPASYAMTNVTAKDYLNMGAESYEGATVSEETYLGQNYATLTVPVTDDAYKQVMYAFDKDGLIVMITFTVMDDDTLEACKGLLKEIQ